MNYIQKIERWGDAHHSRYMDIVRIALGLFLCYKAIFFLNNMSALIGLMGNNNMGIKSFNVVFLGQFIVIIHLMGGLLIAIGIHTRLAALVQIPILVGALILMNNSNVFVTVWDTAITVITLLLLIFFAIIGNGPWSYSKIWHEEEKKH
ncbi:MAG: DoxX family protein [Ferruginibacter sp.]